MVIDREIVDSTLLDRSIAGSRMDVLAPKLAQVLGVTESEVTVRIWHLYALKLLASTDHQFFQVPESHFFQPTLIPRREFDDLIGNETSKEISPPGWYNPWTDPILRRYIP